MGDIDRDKLRDLASDATPGPWTATGWANENYDGNYLVVASGADVASTGKSELYQENAAFIAAASPDVVLALLDKLTHVERLAIEACDRWGQFLGERIVNVKQKDKERLAAIRVALDAGKGGGG